MNIVYIVVDTLRADHLSCYGYFRETSPNIDRVAEDGVVFTNCFSEFPYTLPSFTSHITGICGVGTGVVTNAWRKLNERHIVLDDKTPTLAEILFHSGYATAAVDNMVNFGYHPKWFVRGYQYYINPRPRPPYTSDDALYDDIVRNTDMVLAEEVNYHVLKWLEAHGRDKDFFLFVHYWDPHTPYNLPRGFREKFCDEYYYEPPAVRLPDGDGFVPGWGRLSHLTDERRELVRLYDCEIYYVDHHIGALVDKLEEMGVYDETLIVITSDHGEIMFEDHPGLLKERIEFGHGMLYNEVLHVPLIIKFPGQEFRGRRVDALVQTVDIFPTVLRVAGVEGDFRTDGVDLLSLLEGEWEGRDAVIGTYVSSKFAARSLMSGDWKLITYTTSDVELYDLARDPYETVNVAEEQGDVARQMRDALEARVREYVEKWGRPDPLTVPELLDWQLGRETVWKVTPAGERPDKG